MLTSGEPINEDVAIANVAWNRTELWVHVHFERPVYIIQEIRADKFADDDVDAFVHGERIQNLQREFERSMDWLAKDIYSKDSHFICELIQNADDNEYAEGIRPHLHFTVGTSYLEVQNNERGFRPKDVEALCNINKNTKKQHRRWFIDL